MNDERFYVGDRNLKVSVITPNGAVYDMVQQMTRVSRRIEPSQVILINGARKGAKLQIAEAVRSEVVAFLAWEPMVTKLADSYPQVQVYVIQPSVLDLLRCIYFAPKGGKLGAIIPFALRDYYDDLEDALQVMDVSFYRLAPAYDERELRDLIRRAASQGVTDLIGNDAISAMTVARHMNWITLRPGRGGITRAFFKALWNIHHRYQGNIHAAFPQSGMLAHYHLQDIIGSSQTITEVKELVKVYGATDSTIEVPPLRKRKGDIQEISQALLRMLDIRYHKSHTFDANVWELLKNQPWPGNVRQLAHIIERLVLVVKSQTIQVKDVLCVMPRDVVAEERGELDEEGHLRGRTYEMIEKMSREGKSGAQIAKALGIGQSTVYRIKRRHEDQ